MSDHTDTLSIPDYDLEDELDVDSEAALKALADPTRGRIISLLEERSASISQLADALERPKGSVGHHVKVLENAGLIRVVRTRQVRAITEKFYGRSARWFNMVGLRHAKLAPDFAIRQAFADVSDDRDLPSLATARYARISAERAGEYREELLALVDRFRTEQPDGETVYAILAGILPTTRPYLRPADPEEPS